MELELVAELAYLVANIQLLAAYGILFGFACSRAPLTRWKIVSGLFGAIALYPLHVALTVMFVELFRAASQHLEPNELYAGSGTWLIIELLITGPAYSFIAVVIWLCFTIGCLAKIRKTDLRSK